MRIAFFVILLFVIGAMLACAKLEKPMLMTAEVNGKVVSATPRGRLGKVLIMTRQPEPGEIPRVMTLYDLDFGICGSGSNCGSGERHADTVIQIRETFTPPKNERE
jgi:hypothetical protein